MKKSKNIILSLATTLVLGSCKHEKKQRPAYWVQTDGDGSYVAQYYDPSYYNNGGVGYYYHPVFFWGYGNCYYNNHYISRTSSIVRSGGYYHGGGYAGRSSSFGSHVSSTSARGGFGSSGSHSSGS